MVTTAIKEAPYGSWRSPITSDLIVAQSIALSEVRLDGGIVYWLEGRPQEQGRLRRRAGRVWQAERTPTSTPLPYNVRTRVHEYGGGAWTVAEGTLYFSNFADGRLYRQTDATGRAAAADRCAVSRLATGGLPTASSIDTATSGSACARTTPDRRRAGQRDRRGRSGASGRGARAHTRRWARLLFVALFVARWTTARLARLGPPQHAVGRHHALPRRAGRRRCHRRRAVSDCGRPAESIFQPEWSPDGTCIVFVSDRSGWWNLYRFELATRALRSDRADGGGVRTAAMDFRHVHLCLRRADRIVCTYSRQGSGNWR